MTGDFKESTLFYSNNPFNSSWETKNPGCGLLRIHCHTSGSLQRVLPEIGWRPLETAWQYVESGSLQILLSVGGLLQNGQVIEMSNTLEITHYTVRHQHILQEKKKKKNDCLTCFNLTAPDPVFDFSQFLCVHGRTITKVGCGYHLYNLCLGVWLRINIVSVRNLKGIPKLKTNF